MRRDAKDSNSFMAPDEPAAMVKVEAKFSERSFLKQPPPALNSLSAGKPNSEWMSLVFMENPAERTTANPIHTNNKFPLPEQRGITDSEILANARSADL